MVQYVCHSSQGVGRRREDEDYTIETVHPLNILITVDG